MGAGPQGLGRGGVCVGVPGAELGPGPQIHSAGGGGLPACPSLSRLLLRRRGAGEARRSERAPGWPSPAGLPQQQPPPAGGAPLGAAAPPRALDWREAAAPPSAGRGPSGGSGTEETSAKVAPEEEEEEEGGEAPKPPLPPAEGEGASEAPEPPPRQVRRGRSREGPRRGLAWNPPRASGTTAGGLPSPTHPWEPHTPNSRFSAQ